MVPVITENPNGRGAPTVTFKDDPTYQKSQKQIDFEKKIASGEVESTGNYEYSSDPREKRSFADRSAAYSSYDPATNMVRFYDPEGNVTQEGQRSSGGGMPGFMSDTLKVVGGVGKAVGTVASNPQALLAIAAAVAAPYAAASLAPYLTAFGSYAGVAAQAITNITIQVAQGVPIEKATENALTSAAVSGASSAVQQQLGNFVTNPGVSNAIKSTVSSGLTTAVKGGSQADVEKAMTAGLVSSAASTAFKEAVDVSSPVASAAVGGAAGGAVTGGTEGAVLGGLTSAAGALGSQLTAPAPTPAPPADTGKTSALSPEQISSRIDSIIEQAPGVQTAGALPLAEMTASAALQQAEPLIRLVAEAANDPNYKVLLPAIEQRLGQLGLTIAEVASRLNPAVLAAQLATYSPNAGDPNEDAKMAQIYRDYAGLKLPSAVTPIETAPLKSAPVAGLDITQEQSQAETERLARQNQQVLAPAPAPEEPVTVVRVDPSTGEALVMKPSGEIFTVTIDPSTKPGSTISVPSPTPTPAPSPSPAPAPAPVPSPAPTPVPQPTPEPVFRPAPEPVPAPELSPELITPPPSVVKPLPLAPAPISEKDKQLIELIRPEPPATKDGAPSEPAPAPITEPTPVPELPKEDVPVDVDADGKPIKTPDESVEDTGAEPKQPVYDYDPKAKPPSDVFTKTVLSPKTKSSAALGQALGTTGLTAYRGAGEIEAPGTGKARRKVWNEESLKLKDALGV